MLLFDLQQHPSVFLREPPFGLDEDAVGQLEVRQVVASTMICNPLLLVLVFYPTGLKLLGNLLFETRAITSVYLEVLPIKTGLLH